MLVIKYNFNLLFVLCILFNACSSVIERNEPDFKPKIYAASNIEMAIVRKQNNESISCAAKDFNKYACFSYEDLICLQEILDSCERFSSTQLSCDKK